MTYSIPPQILRDAKDDLFMPHYTGRYEKLILYITRRGYPVVSLADIEREQARRGILPEKPVSKVKHKRKRNRR